MSLGKDPVADLAQRFGFDPSSKAHRFVDPSSKSDLPSGKERAVKLTTALYYTPNGRSIQQVGIVPDVVLEQEPANGDAAISFAAHFLRNSAALTDTGRLARFAELTKVEQFLTLYSNAVASRISVEPAQTVTAAAGQASQPIATSPSMVAVASENRATDKRKPARRVALVIGNDTYQHVNHLVNARADARAMAKALEGVGFQVQLRLDVGDRAMKEAVRTFKGQINGGDDAVFYFSGHGVQLGTANYLLPTDVNGESEDQVKDEALPLQRVLDDLADQKAGFSLAIIDACRNNPFRSAGRSIGGRGLAPTTAATGQMVLYSAGTGQEALDRLGAADHDPNGLFTRVLLKEMEVPGVPVDRVLRNVRNEVVRLSKSVGQEQVPALYDQALGDFYFRPVR